MEKYLGVKIVNAEPMTEFKHLTQMGKVIPRTGIASAIEDRHGYQVTYEDGYKSWSPKETFEKAYRKFDETQNGLVIDVDPRDGAWGFIPAAQRKEHCVEMVRSLAKVQCAESLIEASEKIYKYLYSE